MARDEDRERKKRLNKMMKDLQDVDPAGILVHLTCLSAMRKEQIRRIWKNDGAMIAAGELFEELPKRENWYSTLVTALREIGRDDLADKLEGPEKKSAPSGSSQSVATGQTSHNASVTQNQGAQQSPPATNPHPPAPQERSLEAEASASLGFPDIAAEKDAPQKGVGKDKKPSGPVENSGQQSQAGASLPMPVQERKQDTSASDLAPGESVSGGLAASSPSSDQQRHGRSESDEPNISPPTQAEETAAIKPSLASRESGSGGPVASSPSSGQQRHGRSESDERNISPPTPMQAETAAIKPSNPSRESGSSGPVASSPSSGQRRHGESESDECNISSNGRPPRMQAEETAALKPGNPSPTAASGGRVSVRPRDDRQTGRENTVGRMEGEVESGGERERKESREEGRDKKDLNFQNHLKNLNIQKVKDPPGDKMNNLSPSTDVPELFSKKENKDKSQSQSAVENTDDVCPTGGIRPLRSHTDESLALDDMSSCDILIDPTISQGGSNSQQTEEGTGVQGADRDGGTRDVAVGNQDSLLMTIRGYIPSVCNAVSRHILNQ